MGRVSLSTWVCFALGMGMIVESFHKTGTSPEDKDVLNIDVTGSASSYANSFKIVVEYCPGP